MDSYDRILVATDGSPGSTPVIEHSIRLARLSDAEVQALYVVDHRYPSATEYDMIVERMEDEGTKALDTIETAATEHGINVHKHLRRGVPADEIVAAADQYDADVIVVGTHGRSAIGRFIHAGSVTERVVRTAEIPVFVTRIRPADDPAMADVDSKTTASRRRLPGIEPSGGT
ncbi:universal stress protein [Halalkalirubrum salinum]|uniref:universal stress protein n=1 Tax=Halalkalirubrum salinum TaxID=2563889 RepID=UPI0010FB3C7A|nr:universal stress protein [Halalkalirubrum salinum]